MTDQAAPTLGSKIDAVLAPFVEDEAKLQKRLAAIHDEAERLKIEMQQVNEDLDVVKAAKVDALRHAAESDPLLSAVFGGNANPKLVADDESEEPKLEVIEDPAQSDGHPLLSHAS